MVFPSLLLSISAYQGSRLCRGIGTTIPMAMASTGAIIQIAVCFVLMGVLIET